MRNRPVRWATVSRSFRWRFFAKYVVFYESADDVASKAPMHFAAHRARGDEFHAVAAGGDVDDAHINAEEPVDRIGLRGFGHFDGRMQVSM